MFLFELVLVLTRPVVQDKDGMVQFQVYRQPLPAAQILLEDLPDGEGSSSGSFRSALTGNDKGKTYVSLHTVSTRIFKKQQFKS